MKELFSRFNVPAPKVRPNYQVAWEHGHGYVGQFLYSDGTVACDVGPFWQSEVDARVDCKNNAKQAGLGRCDIKPLVQAYFPPHPPVAKLEVVNG